MQNDYLQSAKHQFEYYKKNAEKTFDRLTDEQLNWKYNEESNSIATIVWHVVGNMLCDANWESLSIPRKKNKI